MNAPSAARPVILTAVAAALAFSPLTQSLFWGTMAYTLIGGTIVGTVLTLLFLPDALLHLVPGRAESSGGHKGLTKGCLVGMFAQELSLTHPRLRGLCHEKFSWIAKDFETDLAEAKAVYAPGAAFDPKNVGMLYVSIVQGSLMLAKASESNRVLSENIEQFRTYLQTLFGRSRGSTGKTAGQNLRRIAELTGLITQRFPMKPIVCPDYIPTSSYSAPLAASEFRFKSPGQAERNSRPKVVMNNSFGFGGINTSMILRQ